MITYIKKIPPTDKVYCSELMSEGWTKLKEPAGLGKTILFSAPFMIINGVISLILAYLLFPPLKEFLTDKNGFNFSLSINLFSLAYIAAIFMFILFHEFIHACFFPGLIKSNKIFWGINGFYGFVFTTEKVKKGRFILISIMPFLLLSIVLPFILYFLGWLSAFIIFLCLINAMGSSVDFLNIYLITAQVPNGSLLVNSGTETYFFSPKSNL